MAHTPLGRLGQGLAPQSAAGGPSQPLRPPLSDRRSFTLSVPATSANLGPGYDTLGVALEMRDRVTVTATPARDPGAPEVTVEVDGEGAADLPGDASHLVIAVVESVLASKGWSLPDMQVRATNVIPHSRGLGSSAAAIATAVVTADQLIPGGLSAEEKLQIGSKIEGHPDNYVPALRGGLAVSWESGSPQEPLYRTAALRPHADLTTVVAIPGFVQSTQAARDVLPASIPHAQAAMNSARTALLVHALTTDPDLLLEGTEDFLHQHYRRQAFPASMGLVDALRAAGHAAVISGAGPAILVLTPVHKVEAVDALITELMRSSNSAERFTPQNLPIASSGVTLEVPR